ncbi:MAG: NUDIX hydrolase [Candidatus Cloacimonetes bacterium]|nr:NUDIX hydrolase [Candidatus Cloacimonadota bacterium]
MNKHLGVSMIFLNRDKKVLLFLRDNKPGLPYRDMWDIPGGHVDKGETPESCIIREMKEEMDLDLQDFQLFCCREFKDRIEYTFRMKSDLNIDAIKLTEGQRLKWFSREEAANTELAYGFNEILEDFYTALE